MPPKERAADRGSRRGRGLLLELVRELRIARIGHGLSQESVGNAVGLSGSEVGRIERGQISSVSPVNLARLLSVVGLDLTARAYPTGTSLRDKAQIVLLGRLRAELAPTLTWRTEVPVGPRGDLRAWDAVIGTGAQRIGVEAETRLVDLQATERRMALKCRDSSIQRAILLMADTRTNRTTLRTLESALSGSFPISGRDALANLRAGRVPAGNAIVLL
ncbi:MAG: helix-turn-helix domain-containing protein [Candidatus Limnocylindrales bacterium]